MKVKIEITNNGDYHYPYDVDVYDKNGECIESRTFQEREEAGRFAFEMKQFYEFYKED